MNAFGIAFTLVSGALLIALPRRLAPIPLLLAAAYVTRGAELEIGPAHFTVLRILVAVGFLRVVARGERLANGWNAVDRSLMVWGALLIALSVFHTSNAWILRMGLVWTELGCYFLFRVFIHDAEDVKRIFKVLCIVLVPVALLMLLEKATAQNYFSALGGYTEAVIREGRVRARGAFAHPILAGSVGATCFGMAVYLWRSQRIPALIGLFAAGGIVFASTSSGPVMMVLFVLLGIGFWKVRRNLRAIRWLALVAILGLDLVMKDPVYFLMARIDIAGGSTGWHRARLIQSSFEHLDEWWLAGTDYTRHWMPTGIHANEIHTDITNHLLGVGVMGGLPLVLVFILVLVAAFRLAGRALRESKTAPFEQRFLIWTLGAILFGHVMNFFTISLFDQSIVFFYLILAAIGAVQSRKRSSRGFVVTLVDRSLGTERHAT